MKLRRYLGPALGGLLLVSVACARPPPPDSRPREEPGSRPPSGDTASGTESSRNGDGPDTPPPETVALEAERLKKLGPLYTPFETGPKIVWNMEAERVLTQNLLPVLREEGLPAATRALFWVLVAADGHVADVVVQTSSENAAFDRAAAEVAMGLRFRPATTNDRPHAVWVIREISLLMQ